MSTQRTKIISLLEALIKELKQAPEPPVKAKPGAPQFDLVRVSKSKESVGFSPKTIRSFFDQGLKRHARSCGRRSKMVFFSRSELEQFLKEKAE